MNAPNTEASTSRFVTITEAGQPLRLHYNDVGSGSEVVVMLHGSGPGASGWANFHRNIEPLVDARYRVILLDGPGWSKSDTIVSTGSRSDLNARCLKAVLDAQDISRVHLIGNSMGGHSAVGFALANPEMVGKLILMGGATGGPSALVPMSAEGIKFIGALYRDPTVENLKRMMNVFVYDTSNLTEELCQQRLSNILARRDHLENFVKSSQINPKQFSDYGLCLPEIKAKTLIIWGVTTASYPWTSACACCGAFPTRNSTCSVSAAIGHSGSTPKSSTIWFKTFSHADRPVSPQEVGASH